MSSLLLNMNNEAKERRAKNFLEEEKSLLLDIVEKCVDIIENRNHTSNSIALKRKTWNLITNLFNARNGNQRDGWQLRHLYSNMKKRVTKDLEERKLHKMSESDVRLLNIMSTKIEGELKPNEIFEEIKNIEIVISDSETPDALQEIEVQSIPIPSISPIENESSKPIDNSILPSTSCKGHSLLRTALITKSTTEIQRSNETQQPNEMQLNEIQRPNNIKISDQIVDTSKFPNRKRDNERRKDVLNNQKRKEERVVIDQNNDDHSYTSKKEVHTVLHNHIKHHTPHMKRKMPEMFLEDDALRSKRKVEETLDNQKEEHQLNIETMKLEKEIKWFELNKILPLRKEREQIEIDVKKTDRDIKKMELKIKELEYKILFKKYENY